MAIVDKLIFYKRGISPQWVKSPKKWICSFWCTHPNIGNHGLVIFPFTRNDFFLRYVPRCLKVNLHFPFRAQCRCEVIRSVSWFCLRFEFTKWFLHFLSRENLAVLIGNSTTGKVSKFTGMHACTACQVSAHRHLYWSSIITFPHEEVQSAVSAIFEVWCLHSWQGADPMMI